MLKLPGKIKCGLVGWYEGEKQGKQGMGWGTWGLPGGRKEEIIWGEDTGESRVYQPQGHHASGPSSQHCTTGPQFSWVEAAKRETVAKLKIQRKRKIGLLVGGNERRKQEKGQSCAVYQGKERENSEGGGEWDTLHRSFWVLCLYILKLNWCQNFFSSVESQGSMH